MNEELLKQLKNLLAEWNTEKYPDPEDPRGWEDYARYSCAEELVQLFAWHNIKID